MSLDFIRLSNIIGEGATEENHQQCGQMLVDFIQHPDAHHGRAGDESYVSEEDEQIAQRVSEPVLFAFALGQSKHVHGGQEYINEYTMQAASETVGKMFHLLHYIEEKIPELQGKKAPVGMHLLQDTIEHYLRSSRVSELAKYYGFHGLYAMDIKLYATRMRPCQRSNGRSWKSLEFELKQNYSLKLPPHPERELTQRELEDENMEVLTLGEETRHLNEEICSCKGVLFKLPFTEALQ